MEPLDGPEETEDADPNYEGKLFHIVLTERICVFPQCVFVTVTCVPAGELYITANAYKAEQEDEISLELGETIEVIHKLLDGWWVVRYDVASEAAAPLSFMKLYGDFQVTADTLLVYSHSFGFGEKVVNSSGAFGSK